MKKMGENFAILFLTLTILITASTVCVAALEDFDINHPLRLSPPDGSFPLILKNDLAIVSGNKAEDYNETQELGLLGNPLYRVNKSGDLTGVFINTLESKPTSDFWRGGLKYFEYKSSNDYLVADQEWNFRTALIDSYKLVPSGRYFTPWFGTPPSGGGANDLDGRTFNESNSYPNILIENLTRNGERQRTQIRYGSSWMGQPHYNTPAPYLSLSDTIYYGLCKEVSLDKVTDIVGEARSYDFHPSLMLICWMKGADYKIGDTYKVSHKPSGVTHYHDLIRIQYSNGNAIPSTSGMREMLPDFGKGSIALTENPLDVAESSMYGHLQFVRENTPKGYPSYLYAHTNDGILHIINVEGVQIYTRPSHVGGGEYKVKGWGRIAGSDSIDRIQKGNERLAFSPPNVTQGKRLVQQKFKMQISDDHTLLAEKWRDDTPPSFLLDGDMIVYDLYGTTHMSTLDSWGRVSSSTSQVVQGGSAWTWTTNVLGTMGRGGAGLYAISVTTFGFNDSAYNFRWAVENNLYRFNPTNRVGETRFWTGNTKHTQTGEKSGGGNILSSWATYVNSPDVGRLTIMRQPQFPGIHHGMSIPYYESSKNPDYSNEEYDEETYFFEHDRPYKSPWNYWRLGWNVPRPAFGVMEVVKKNDSRLLKALTSKTGQIPNNPLNPYEIYTRSLDEIIKKGTYLEDYDTYKTDAGGAFQLMIIPGGQQYYTDLNDNGTIGAAIYLVNPHNGRIVHRFTANNKDQSGKPVIENVEKLDEVDGFKGTANPKMGMITTPPITIAGKKASKDSLSSRFLRTAFTADNRGNIFEVPFVKEKGVVDGEGKYDLYQNPWDIVARRVATLMPDKEKLPEWWEGAPEDIDCYTIPYRLAVASNGNAEAMSDDLWICGGTANVPTVKVPGSKYADMKNKKQYIFGFNRPPHGVEIKDDSSHHKMSIISHGERVYPNSKSYERKKWYILLGEDDPDEYVSAAPVMYSGQLYVATYLPTRKESRYYVLNPTTGCNPGKEGAKYYTIKGIHVKGIAPVRIDGKARIVLAYTGNFYKSENKDVDGKKLIDNDGTEGLLSLSPSIGSETIFEKHKDYLYYWNRRNF